MAPKTRSHTRKRSRDGELGSLSGSTSKSKSKPGREPTPQAETPIQLSPFEIFQNLEQSIVAGERKAPDDEEFNALNIPAKDLQACFEYVTHFIREATDPAVSTTGKNMRIDWGPAIENMERKESVVLNTQVLRTLIVAALRDAEKLCEDGG